MYNTKASLHSLTHSLYFTYSFSFPPIHPFPPHSFSLIHAPSLNFYTPTLFHSFTHFHFPSPTLFHSLTLHPSLITASFTLFFAHTLHPSLFFTPSHYVFTHSFTIISPYSFPPRLSFFTHSQCVSLALFHSFIHSLTLISHLSLPPRLSFSLIHALLTLLFLFISITLIHSLP